MKHYKEYHCEVVLFFKGLKRKRWCSKKLVDYRFEYLPYSYFTLIAENEEEARKWMMSVGKTRIHELFEQFTENDYQIRFTGRDPETKEWKQSKLFIESLSGYVSDVRIKETKDYYKVSYKEAVNDLTVEQFQEMFGHL